MNEPIPSLGVMRADAECVKRAGVGWLACDSRLSDYVLYLVAEAERLRTALKCASNALPVALDAIDECYMTTGHIRVAYESEQRRQIKESIEQARSVLAGEPAASEPATAAEPPATAGKTPGQVAYEACMKAGGFSGEGWSEEGSDQAAWEAAARAVLGMEPRWIPVSESLPENQQNVLFIVDDSPNMDFLAHRMLGGKYIGEYGGFSVPGLHFGDCVTHWMPMPPAPDQPAAVKESEVQS